jgi:hypothetical protein
VAETSETPLQDLHSLRLCNKATKRASSSYTIANRFNLEHHYQSTNWNSDEYIKTIDWLQGANNRQALFVKGIADMMARPGGEALLTRAEEGDLQASYVLAILKYYKHDLIDDVFNHIRCMYGEITFGLQVKTRWSMEYKDCDEGEAHILGVHK